MQGQILLNQASLCSSHSRETNFSPLLCFPLDCVSVQLLKSPLSLNVKCIFMVFLTKAKLATNVQLVMRQWHDIHEESEISWY